MNGIAVRIYKNPKYGKSIGLNITNTNIYNGTIDIGAKKYIFDLQAVGDAMPSFAEGFGFLRDTLTDHLVKLDVTVEGLDDYLVSQLRRYEAGTKTDVRGLAVLDCKGSEIWILLDDDDLH